MPPQRTLDEKLALYARAGIPDYWVIDTVNPRVEVYREPGLLEGSPDRYGYASKQVFQPHQSIQPLLVPGPPCPLVDFLG